ncbi:hypothetical protein [Emticicia fontis]
MKILAIKNTSTHCKGVVYDLSDEEAKVLIDSKLAIVYVEPKVKKARS